MAEPETKFSLKNFYFYFILLYNTVLVLPSYTINDYLLILTTCNITIVFLLRHMISILEAQGYCICMQL